MRDSERFGKWLANACPGEEVVITGVSGRFPESNNVREFQDNLFSGKNMIIDDDGTRTSLGTGKISNTDKLDSGYFGLHHRQAEMLNPITRKLLETAVEAILDAGVNPCQLAGSKTMVCVGLAYLDMEIETLTKITESQKFALTGFLKSSVANRVSYYLKLRGPSYVLDTGCSSSMNALEEAFKAIRMGKCDNALVGGGHLLFHPNVTTGFLNSGVLSTKGACRVFDEDADGFVRSEAVACVFLQKARNARRIYTQIVYSKANCNGFNDVGILYPSAQFQSKLITEILGESGVDCSEIVYLEAHGTGTKVGDIEEIEGIDIAIAKKTSKPLLVGSLKSNMGHAEGASGLCSLIKAIIAMETGYIAPNLHLKKVKKELVGILEGRIKVVTELTKLESESGVFAINNFGIGGCNVLTLLRRFKKSKVIGRLPQTDEFRLVCVSGRTEKAVSVLLDDVSARPINDGYLGLLHQIFKEEISGHLYRGYTIVSKNSAVKTAIKFSSKNRHILQVVIGQFQKGYKSLAQNMRQLLVFQSLLDKFSSETPDVEFESIESRKLHTHNSFVMQVAFLQMLEMLEIEFKIISVDRIGELIYNNYNYICTGVALGQTLREIDKSSKEQMIQNLYDKAFNKNMEMVHPDSLIVNISDHEFDGDVISFVNDQSLTFLEMLGKLYQEGYNFRLDKLHRAAKFPVGIGTPMVSPLIQWDYRRSWYNCKIEKLPMSHIIQQEHIVSCEIDGSSSYLLGHIIDGRNFIPVSYYLELVWKTVLGNSTKTCDAPIVFENCIFPRPLELRKDETVNLLVTIRRKNGNFIVTENNSIVASGNIFFPSDIQQHQLSFSNYAVNNKRIQFLNQNEIYQKFCLRGFRYSGLFKSFEKYDINSAAALITWRKNWTLFIENMLQLKLLQLEKECSVVTHIQKLIIDPLKHMNQNENSSCLVQFYKENNVIKSLGVQICGISTTNLTRTNLSSLPLLQKYLFIPNNIHTNLEESLRIITQIIVENSSENIFKAVEIFDEECTTAKLFMPIVFKIMEDIPIVVPNFFISSKVSLPVIPEIEVNEFVLKSKNNFLLIIATRRLQRLELLNQVLEVLSSEGFLLTREEINFIPENFENLEIITQHVVGEEKLIILRKTIRIKMFKVIQVQPSSSHWVPQLQRVLENEDNVVIYGQNSNPEGLLGFINCLKKEPKCDKIKCFLIKDTAPPFDINNQFYKKQLKKNLAINIFKNGEWGTYRHLPLERIPERKQFFVDGHVRKAINTIIQGKLHKKSIQVYPFCLCVNDKINTYRREEVNTILEFSGQDIRGCRVMGLKYGQTFSSDDASNVCLLWQIPDNWSLGEASTVPLAYVTAVYSLLRVGKLVAGTSVLIKLADGVTGFAILNVCLHYGCQVFLIVEDQENLTYIKRHYHQIPESHISNSVDTHFEKMIKTKTQELGVDIAVNTSNFENVEATLRCMALGATFLQIGEVSPSVDTFPNLFFLQKSINFHNVTPDSVFFETLRIKTWIVDKIYEGMKLGYVTPLPKTVFQLNEIGQAYKYMTNKHMGKIVVQIRNDNDKAILSQHILKEKARSCFDNNFYCDSDKSYIILGGLGGFGLELVDWLCDRGARNLVLVSRRGIQTGYQNEKTRKWKSLGVTVHIFTGDITREEECLDLVRQCSELGIIDGIFNLAAVLKDALFENQSEESFNLVLAPKAYATVHLDHITRQYCPLLRYFIVFSSLSSGYGLAGQTNYGMANSITEEICERRKLDGFPAMAIQWGPVDDVGVIFRMNIKDDPLLIEGYRQQKLSNCLDVLDNLLTQDSVIVSSVVLANKKEMCSITQSKSIVDAAASILGIKNLKTIDLHATFAELGLDSITRVKMIEVFKKNFDVDVNVKQIRTMTFVSLMHMETQLEIVA